MKYPWETKETPESILRGLQKQYEETHPNDPFKCSDHLMAIGHERMIDIFQQSKGRKIRVIHTGDLDGYEIDFEN